MAHSAVLVIGPNPEDQLEPFDEHNYGPNPQFDYYSLGGWRVGYFHLKSGATGVRGIGRDIPDTRADQCLWGDVDHAATKDAAVTNAAMRWDKMEGKTYWGLDPDGKPARIPQQQGTREAYVERARRDAMVPFAVLRDGVWFSKADEKDPDKWATWVRDEVLAMLDPDTLVSLYDVHC